MTYLKNTSKTGDLGEDIAVKYLKSRNFIVLDTKYLKSWGELDIVAKNKGIVHFVEVKTFSYASKSAIELAIGGEDWRPEELVDERKLHQISKIAQTWLSENNWTGEFQVDVIAVRMAPAEKYATVNWIENVMTG